MSSFKGYSKMSSFNVSADVNSVLFVKLCSQKIHYVAVLLFEYVLHSLQ